MYTVVDIETTGLSKHYHRITEIAAVKLRNGRIVDSFETFVNPHMKIPMFITKLTGITNEMVKEAPPIQKVMPEFVEFLGKDVFVAHNATFDYGFLNARCSMANEKLCTRKLANRLFPELPRKRLSDLCAHMQIENVRAHRAKGDVLATSVVFNSMLGILKTKGITEVEEVLKFERDSRRSHTF